MAHAAWKWLAVAAAIGAGVLACSSDDDDGGTGKDDAGTSGIDAGVNKVRPGLGEDPGTPEGTLFSFPAGVSISGTPYGADEATRDCGNGIAPQGSGPAVLVCVPLRNTTGGPVVVQLPPGLTMISTSEGRIQSGLLVERVFITVPPTPGPGGLDGGTDPDAHVVPIHMYCLNEARGPSETHSPYMLGPISSDPDVQELLSLIAGKSIDNEDEVDVVQDAIYSITEGNGLTTEDRQRLSRL